MGMCHMQGHLNGEFKGEFGEIVGKIKKMYPGPIGIEVTSVQYVMKKKTSTFSGFVPSVKVMEF